MKILNSCICQNISISWPNAVYNSSFEIWVNFSKIKYCMQNFYRIIFQNFHSRFFGQSLSHFSNLWVNFSQYSLLYRKNWKIKVRAKTYFVSVVVDLKTFFCCEMSFEFCKINRNNEQNLRYYFPNLLKIILKSCHVMAICPEMNYWIF